MPFSILHISDLHRTPGEHLSNAEMISALVGDRSRYMRENPPIRPPDAIIVSGDIIQGVPLGFADATAQLRAQYDAAESFLTEITDRFIDGDRSRLILVPGNHDIDWAASKAAMVDVPADAMPLNLGRDLFAAGSDLRWDWKTQKLYRIQDVSAYARRLDAYWDFFDRFYAGVGGLLNVARGRDANLYSLANGLIGVAAFNSCQGNDCFSYQGAIPREAVAQASLDLLAEPNAFELLIAVWHHNIEGPPQRSDYMDVDIVRGMIGRGFRMGLYGHQHRPDAVPFHIHLAQRETMAAVSAGSLCAGARELPPGTHRGYNVIEIHDDFLGARIHVREVEAVTNLFTRGPRMAFGGESYTDLRWEAPPDLMGRPRVPAAEAMLDLITEAERLRRSQPAEALALLRPQEAVLPPFGRRLLIDLALNQDDLDLASRLLSPPTSIEELAELMELHIRRRAVEDGRDVLDRHATALGLPQPQAADYQRRLDALEVLKR